MPLQYIHVEHQEDLPASKMFYYIERIKDINKQALLDWFTPHERITVLDIPENLVGTDLITVTGTVDELYNLKNAFAVHITKDKQLIEELKTKSGENPVSDPTDKVQVYGVLAVPGKDNVLILIKLIDNGLYGPFSMDERFWLSEGMIANYHGEPILTDVGKFLCNYLGLADPFGDIIPYINGEFNLKKVGKVIAKNILDGKINRKMFNKYMNNCSWYGMDGSICVTTWTDKSLTTDPAIAKRKAELLEQYKDQLDDPIVAKKIENELVAMDKAWVKGDPSESYFAVTGNKVFAEHRKKMYIMYGLVVAFDKNTGSYTFTSDSLQDGWSKNTMPVLANEIRRGSYSRGVETAKGGEQTKYITRTFQNITIEEEDCGTQHGIEILLTEDNWKNFDRRWLTNGTMLDEKTAKGLIGKVVKIRSPMHCNTKEGFCYKCCGEKMKRVGIKVIGMQVLGVTGTLMGLAMDAFHISSIPSKQLNSIDGFLIESQ